MKAEFVLILVLFACNVSHSQARQGQSGSSAQSSLTVTATVESSVWLVMESDGKPGVVVANAADPKESFYHGQAKPHRKRVAPAETQNSSATSRELPHHQDDGAVQFSFPAAHPFEVTRKTVMMNVSESGKTERRPVMVTTVVPQ